MSGNPAGLQVLAYALEDEPVISFVRPCVDCGRRTGSFCENDSPASGSRRRAGTQGSGLHTAQCVRLGTRCATIADGSPGRHRRPPSEASSAATEHANDDNTGPRGSDATERAATIEVMTTPACDAATDGRRLGAATEHAKLVVTERAHAQAYCRS